MKFLIVTFLFYCQNNYNILFHKKLNTYLNVKVFSGNDERYSVEKNETEIKMQLHNLQKIFEKKRLLKIIQDNNVSINTKIELLKDNSVKASNLKAGGLFNEFDFYFY
jgi:hypothetical protein